MSQADMNEKLIARILAIEAKLDLLSGFENGEMVFSTANVSNPPTDAQLDTAFGAPATLPLPFIGIIDDAGGGATAWLVWHDGTNWWYEQGTVAI